MLEDNVNNLYNELFDQKVDFSATYKKTIDYETFLKKNRKNNFKYLSTTLEFIVILKYSSSRNIIFNRVHPQDRLDCCRLF